MRYNCLVKGCELNILTNLIKVSEMSRRCRNSSDTFCYICGEFTLKSQKRSMTAIIKKGYELYFGCKIGDQDKVWAPHICCSSCATSLRAWLAGKRPSMPFAIPMIWREQNNHVTDCYFCMTNVTGFSSKNRKSIEYPNLASAMRPVPHDESLPVPTPPSFGHWRTRTSMQRQMKCCR